jgi:hypothetical protein
MDENRLSFHDPWITTSKTIREGSIDVRYPEWESGKAESVISELTADAERTFKQRTPAEIQDSLRRVDRFFGDPGNPEVRSLADLIQRTSGFSAHDIEKYGLGIFPLLVNYDPAWTGTFVEKALKSAKPVETVHGFLQRFGFPSPWTKWREPSLLSHFVSGNVVGYTAVLVRMGFPIKQSGAAQILKIPSATAFFPMIYLDMIEKIDPELRKTVAAGYWKGGDDDLENEILSRSDAVNALGSDETIKDIGRRLKKFSSRAVFLCHGHKIGAAYIASPFLEDEDLLNMILANLAKDICAFDGGACYTPKNIYVQGDARRFGEKLIAAMTKHAEEISPVSVPAVHSGKELAAIYRGCPEVLSAEGGSGIVRLKQKPEFWLPEVPFRYVQVMPVTGADEVKNLLKPYGRFLQTVVAAVPDHEILSLLDKFGRIGVSNIHHPGSAAFLNVYEEPHDGEFDALKIRYPYRVRFCAVNFKSNRDWLPV